jgi:hypothetical protein
LHNTFIKVGNNYTMFIFYQTKILEQKPASLGKNFKQVGTE